MVDLFITIQVPMEFRGVPHFVGIAAASPGHVTCDILTCDARALDVEACAMQLAALLAAHSRTRVLRRRRGGESCRDARDGK